MSAIFRFFLGKKYSNPNSIWECQRKSEGTDMDFSLCVFFLGVFFSIHIKDWIDPCVQQKHCVKVSTTMICWNVFHNKNTRRIISPPNKTSNLGWSGPKWVYFVSHSLSLWNIAGEYLSIIRPFVSPSQSVSTSTPPFNFTHPSTIDLVMN